MYIICTRHRIRMECPFDSFKISRALRVPQKINKFPEEFNHINVWSLVHKTRTSNAARKEYHQIQVWCPFSFSYTAFYIQKGHTNHIKRAVVCFVQSCTLCSHEHERCTSIHSSCGSITFAQHSHKKSILRSWSGIFKHFEWVTFFHYPHAFMAFGHTLADHMLNDKVMENCVIVTSCSESISCIIHTSHSLLFTLKQLTARHNNVEYSSVRTTNTFLRATKNIWWK